MKKFTSILFAAFMISACSAPSGVIGEQTMKSCEDAGGNWLEEYRECELVSKEWCDGAGGMFDECGSACRHDPQAEICTQQCVPFCKL